MEEVWKDIPGYEGQYQASTLGRIRSLDRLKNCKNMQIRYYKGQILKPRKILQSRTCFCCIRKRNKRDTRASINNENVCR